MDLDTNTEDMHRLGPGQAWVRQGGNGFLWYVPYLLAGLDS